MKIVIDRIDASRPKAIGCTNMTSYPVHFKSAMFDGWARFVPAAEDPVAYLNQEIEVEIAHESIGGLRVIVDQKHQVVPLAEEFSYHVLGEVKVITHHSEPKGNRTTYIVAGDTAFALTWAEIGDVEPSEGETVEFDVSGLSLWDEKI